MNHIKRQNILGVEISAINMQRAVQVIFDWCRTKSRNYVCVTPAHGIMECLDDPELRRIFNTSGMTTPDGMAVVWLLKLYGHKEVSRVYGPDLMLAVCEQSVSRNYRHYFYGGAPGIAEQLSDKLHSRFPGLQVVGTYSPPYRELSPEEDQKIIEKINASQADIVWLGISTPKQERWMHAHLGKLDAPVMVGVGAAFDFLSGNKKQAPKWMQRTGLEWIFRFVSEPVRLWPRYRQYPKFVLLALLQLFGFKHYDS